MSKKWRKKMNNWVKKRRSGLNHRWDWKFYYLFKIVKDGVYQQLPICIRFPTDTKFITFIIIFYIGVNRFNRWHPLEINCFTGNGPQFFPHRILQMFQRVACDGSSFRFGTHIMQRTILTISRIFFHRLAVMGFLPAWKAKSTTTWAGIFISFWDVDKLTFGNMFRFAGFFNSHSRIRNISVDIFIK